MLTPRDAFMQVINSQALFEVANYPLFVTSFSLIKMAAGN